MAKRFRAVDRDQRFLLPVDMVDWLPADHQVWLVLDVVGHLDLRALTGRYALGGAGRRAFDPAMMLALLIYGYATGVRSSRAIERACHTDVAFRVICAQDVPDHTQIARFRQRHLAEVTDLFAQVLAVCARAGYVRLGIVAIDGTKIAASASIDATHGRDFYVTTVAALAAQAAAADAEEDALFGDRRGDEPPDGGGRGAAGRAERAERLRRCLDELNTEQARAGELSQAQQRQAADYLRRARTESIPGRTPRGVDPVALAEAKATRLTANHGPDNRFTRAAVEAARAAATAATAAVAAVTVDPSDAPPTTATATGDRKKVTPPQRNSTDPDSRLMPTRKGFIQGYNAQLAASGDHFIIAGDLVQDTGDVNQLLPMLTKTTTAATALRPHRPDPTTDATIGTVLADNGYCSQANLTAPGPDRLIATGKSRHLHHAATTDPTTGDPPAGITATQAMHHRLRTTDGAALYKKRGATIEPINGHLKDRIGLRTFLLRGLPACTAELTLAALAHNLRRLHTLQHA
jgi:transposase